jgi:hypothetical protein
MFRPKAILQACLLILIGSFLFDAHSYGQSGEVLNSPQKRFEISFGGGWGLYSMTKLDNYIDEVARSIEMFGGHTDIGHINDGPNVFGEVGYFVSPKVSASLGITYLHGGIRYKDTVILTSYSYFGIEVDTFFDEGTLTTTSIAPGLKIKYHFFIEKIDFSFTGGAAWCFGKYVRESTVKSQYDSSSWKSPLTAQGMGFLASTGASYHLNKTFSIGAEIGYRYFPTGDLKEKEGKSGEEQKVGTYASETLRKSNLDFSGPFILGSLSIRL